MTLELDKSDPQLLKVRFSIDGEMPPGPVSVVGNFNEWLPGLDELLPDADRQRSVTVGVPYGERLVFRYLAADDGWFDEPDADEVTEEGSVIHPIALEVLDLREDENIEAEPSPSATESRPPRTR